MQNSSLYKVMQAKTTHIFAKSTKRKTKDFLSLCPHIAQVCEFFVEIKMLVDNNKIHQNMQNSSLYEFLQLETTRRLAKNPKSKKKHFVPLRPHRARVCEFFLQIKILVHNNKIHQKMQNSSLYKTMQLEITHRYAENHRRGKKILPLYPHSAQDCVFIVKMEMLVGNNKIHQKMSN